MRSKLNALAPALDMLSKHVKVLPTSGGAIEDLELPDAEEVEDMLRNRENNAISEFGESPMPSIKCLYRHVPPIYRAERQLYDFFIDGSRSVYYLGSGIESNRSFPIALAQIGAAVIQRDEHGRVHALDIQHRLLLLIPKGSLGVSDTVWDKLETFNSRNALLRVVDLAQNINNDGKATRENLRNRAQGVASDHMHKLEVAAINLTDDIRNYDRRLILDGGVNWDIFIDKPHLIGVAKNFSKLPQLRFGNKRESIDIIRIVSKLPYEHRTIAFMSPNRKTTFWYVRLRKPENMQYALQGVVKVEIPLLDRQPVAAEEIDLISRTLVAERNVTPYGRDHRWHCHLYPIFQAEQAIKTAFYSPQVIKGMIRWPRNIEQEVSL